ncbi:hypothetical protein [Methylomonas sp. ZR1]|uniref:hypothetical protein n=1 Tax=Methylomonas sp. ZR1 TaxID=1797072 RepID=UPI0014917C14|nr:hypothetical protein [Methylomonas sp. ZR1]NOV29253.1 hypothetical protein [Methylomonas sp. ZR1]
MDTIGIKTDNAELLTKITQDFPVVLPSFVQKANNKEIYDYMGRASDMSKHLPKKYLSKSGYGDFYFGVEVGLIDKQKTILFESPNDEPINVYWLSRIRKCIANYRADHKSLPALALLQKNDFDANKKFRLSYLSALFQNKVFVENGFLLIFELSVPEATVNGVAFNFDFGQPIYNHNLEEYPVIAINTANIKPYQVFKFIKHVRDILDSILSDPRVQELFINCRQA